LQVILLVIIEIRKLIFAGLTAEVYTDKSN